MMNFEFDYKGHKIQVINTYSGREKVFLDDELVSSKVNLSFNGKHQLTVADELLTIKIQVQSALKGEVTVSLYRGQTLLETMSQSCDLELMSEEPVQFDTEELQWKKEIEMADSTTVMMYALYFGLIFYSVLTTAFEDNTYGLMALGVSVVALIAAIADFVRTSVKELRKTELTDDSCVTVQS